jgi:NAD(P)-dependent dehydrogenase (short-subunit alcohol dehydrogenase family)
MKTRLDGKRCLVTGGSRNLGRAICLALARAGARVAFTFRERTEEAEETKSLLRAEGIEPLSFQGSVADASHVAATVKAVEGAWGGVDVLINNAGLTQILPIALLEEDEWDAVMDTNVKGTYLFSRAALRSMIRARRGHILNVGSFGADRVVEAPVHYAASKAALVGFSMALAKEVGRYGVAVNCLVPGLLETGLSARLPRHRVDSYVAQAALGRLGTVEEVAELCAWLVSDENSFMTGGQVVIDGGL